MPVPGCGAGAAGQRFCQDLVPKEERTWSCLRPLHGARGWTSQRKEAPRAERNSVPGQRQSRASRRAGASLLQDCYTYDPHTASCFPFPPPQRYGETGLVSLLLACRWSLLSQRTCVICPKVPATKVRKLGVVCSPLTELKEATYFGERRKGIFTKLASQNVVLSPPVSDSPLDIG